MNVERLATDPIDNSTLATLNELDPAVAMDLLDDLEKHHSNAKDSNNYLRMAARWLGVGKERTSSAELIKLRRMVQYLNNEVCPDVPLDSRAIKMLETVDAATALRLCEDLAMSVPRIWNMGVYLKERIREIAPEAASALPEEEEQEEHEEEFQDAMEELPGVLAAAGAADSLDTAQGKTLVRAVLERVARLWRGGRRHAGEVHEEAAASNGLTESVAGRDHVAAGPGAHHEEENSETGKIRMRAAWLNRHVLGNRPIDDSAVQALTTLSVARAMELFEELEARHVLLKSPSDWLRQRTAEEHFQMPWIAAGPL